MFREPDACSCDEHGHDHDHGDHDESRRGFLKLAAGAATALAATSCGTKPDFDALLQKHYKVMTDEEKKKVFARLEERTRAITGVKVHITDPQPMDGVHFAYALNLSQCNGNRRCVEACARENNLPNDPEIRYIRVIEVDNGSQHLEKGTVHYNPEKVPQKGKFYLPVQCHQCDNAPCVRACPTKATWKEPDGIVVVDYNWCIGCRYCQAACPYHARRFNWVAPSIEPERINPNQGYLSNQIRPVGVVEKCTFCLHRTRNGRYPACYEACPTGARKFGNLADPESEVRKIVENKRVWILKEELGTEPRFFYFYG
ncbi:MAG: 4Fe-4S dicluster domain-containing protein [Deltaproteobacteria bacterium]|nr:4Fe-4S dicluster domain-containing protein [Deltaproteobacteria bacterium]